MSDGDEGDVVIFDLDGTLVDSAPDLAASVAHALAHLNQPVPNIAQIRGYIGNGAGRLIHRSLTGEKDGVADDSLFKSAQDLFFKHYADNICERSRPYPGVIETLTTLKNSGYKLACVTNKPERFTQSLLRALNLEMFFSQVLSGDSLQRKKPEPDQLLHVAKHCDVAPKNCTMVGDTATDARAAINAQIPVICVSYGYGNISEMAALGPVAIVDSMAEVEALITDQAFAP
jgi:phosphoglycolate phosphatase